jgi:hypothetical protein
MPEEIPPSEHPTVNYERSDASLGGVVLVLTWALFVAVITFVLMMQFFNKYSAYENAIRKSPFPLAPTPSRAQPPEPRLEQLDRLTGDESSNVYLRLQGREKILNSYGLTEEKGYIHVPIERAMRTLVGKLPARQEQPKDGERENRLLDAGESNSGRLFRKEARWSER